MKYFFKPLWRNKIFILFALLFSFFSPSGYAQIGFNNPNPDSSALIDMKANDRGLLIPRMTTTDRDLMTAGGKKVAHSLLVFDTDQNMFFVYDTIANPDRWLALNPWASQGTDDPNITTVTTGNVGIGTTSAPTEKLEVNGNVKVTGTVNATDYALNPNGNGPVPAGGIIMWSGSTAAIPTGWVLCDGSNGTPDLRERFIVGASRNAADNNLSVTGSPYTVSNTGGANTVTLTSAQIPSHSHTGTTNSTGISFAIPLGGADVDRGGAGSWFSIDDAQTINTTHSHTVSVDDTGQVRNQAHENRPPYYALAFIMKLP
jgi:microcystin-dependent protein